MLSNSKVATTYSYPTQGAGSVRPHAVSGVSGGAWGTQSFTYDANGSMTNEGADTRTYDGLNRMITAVDGANTTSFVYGPDGARLKKTTNGTVTLYLGEDVEITSSVYLKYLPGDAKKTGSGGTGTLYWMHRDHLQSVRAVTRSTGALDDSSAYRPFGEQLGFAGATPQTKGYIGERLDDKTALLYLHARYYDPALGRFMQADPADPTVAGVGVNRYAYALNNPVMMLDPSGLGGEGGQFNHNPGGGLGNAPGSGGSDHGCTCDPGHVGPGYAHDPAIVPGAKLGDFHPGGRLFPRYDWDGTLLSGPTMVGGRLVGETFYNPSNPEMGRYVAALIETPRVRAALAQSSDPIVEIRYRQMGINPFTGNPYYHSYVVVTDVATGEQFFTAAYASGDPDDPAAALESDQFGSGPGFGDLYAVAGPYDASIGLDYQPTPDASQVVLNTDEPMEEIEAILSDYAAHITSLHLEYHALSVNSNAYAHQAVTALGIGRPMAAVNAPGSDTVLP
jgi:RHS repeat-associated protein